jgi:hypothetical protein
LSDDFAHACAERMGFVFGMMMLRFRHGKWSVTATRPRSKFAVGR